MILMRMFQHHAWANRTLIAFLRTLSHEHLALTVPGTYGSSLATIWHIVASNADYVRIIPDTPEVPQIAQDGAFQGWDALAEVAEAADAALVAYVSGITDDFFFVDVDDGTAFELTRSMLLNQLIHHATDHRSQIRTTLSTHGIDSPEVSTWAWRTSGDGQAVLAETAAMAKWGDS
jgi:uncharacterized damage-inducible protein DinB